MKSYKLENAEATLKEFPSNYLYSLYVENEGTRKYLMNPKTNEFSTEAFSGKAFFSQFLGETPIKAKGDNHTIRIEKKKFLLVLYLDNQPYLLIIHEQPLPDDFMSYEGFSADDVDYCGDFDEDAYDDAMMDYESDVENLYEYKDVKYLYIHRSEYFKDLDDFLLFEKLELIELSGVGILENINALNVLLNLRSATFKQCQIAEIPIFHRMNEIHFVRHKSYNDDEEDDEISNQNNQTPFTVF